MTRWDTACRPCRAGACPWCAPPPPQLQYMEAAPPSARRRCRSWARTAAASWVTGSLQGRVVALPQRRTHLPLRCLVRWVQEDAHIAALDLDPATKTSLFAGALAAAADASCSMVAPAACCNTAVPETCR